MKSAQQIIKELDLLPHPEGGYYKETYRADTQVYSQYVEQDRNAITCIYFLLIQGQISRFHRVKHDEIWHFYLGSPLRLIDIDRQQYNIKESILGDYQHALHAQQVIPANHWQAAESLGEYSLVGCSVAPGFDFSDFAFLDTHPERAVIEKYYPELSRFICEFYSPHDKQHKQR